MPEVTRKEKYFYFIFNKKGKRKRQMIKRLDWNENVKLQTNYEYKAVDKPGNTKKPWISSLKSKKYIIPIKIGDGTCKLQHKRDSNKLKYN